VDLVKAGVAQGPPLFELARHELNTVTSEDLQTALRESAPEPTAQSTERVEDPAWIREFAGQLWHHAATS
jgi:hypothetical protein